MYDYTVYRLRSSPIKIWSSCPPSGRHSSSCWAQAEYELGIPPPVRRTNRGCQQSDQYVSSVFDRRSSSPVASVATLGGVRLQRVLPLRPERHSIPRHLWSGPASNPGIRSWRMSGPNRGPNCEGREEFLANVRARLEQAQAVAKRTYDRGHRALSFAPGDWAWLRL